MSNTKSTEPVLGDSGPSVVAVTYVFMVFTIILTLVRASTTFFWKRRLRWDDFLLLVAVGFSIIESILTRQSVHHGLGRFIRPGNSGQLYRFYKTMYAAELLFILSITAAKASIVQLLRRITPRDSLLYRSVPWFHGAIGAWAIFSFFSLAFQCGMPLPWIYLPSRCLGSGALWYPVLILSILTDILLGICILPVLQNLKMTSTQRQMTAVLFGARLLVPIISAVQLALLAPALRIENQPRAMVNPTILRQIAMNLSILTAGILAAYKPVALLCSGAPTGSQSEARYEIDPSGASKSNGWKLSAVSRNQSPEKKYPTITTNELTSKIPPSDAGSPRVTAGFNHSSANKVSRNSRFSAVSDDGTIGETKEWEAKFDESRLQSKDPKSIKRPELSYQQ